MSPPNVSLDEYEIAVNHAVFLIFQGREDWTTESGIGDMNQAQGMRAVNAAIARAFVKLARPKP